MIKRIRKGKTSGRLAAIKATALKRKKIDEDSENSEAEGDCTEEELPLLVDKEQILEALSSSDKKVREYTAIALSNLPQECDLRQLERCLDVRVIDALLHGLHDANANQVFLNLHAIINLMNIDVYNREERDPRQELGIQKLFFERELLQHLYTLVDTLRNNLQRPTLTEQQRFETLKVCAQCFAFLQYIAETAQSQHLALLTQTQQGAQILQIALTLISEKHCEIEALKMFTVLTEFEPTLFQQAGCIDAASSMLTTFLAAKREQSPSEILRNSLLAQIILNTRVSDHAVLSALAEFAINTLSIQIFKELSNFASVSTGITATSKQSSAIEQEVAADNFDEEDDNQADEQLNTASTQQNKQPRTQLQQCFKIWMDSAEALKNVLLLLSNVSESENDSIFQQSQRDEQQQQQKTVVDEEWEDECEEDEQGGGDSLSEQAQQYRALLLQNLLSKEVLFALVEKSDMVSYCAENEKQLNDALGEVRCAEIVEMCLQINDFALSTLLNIVSHPHTSVNQLFLPANQALPGGNNSSSDTATIVLRECVLQLHQKLACLIALSARQEQTEQGLQNNILKDSASVLEITVKQEQLLLAIFKRAGDLQQRPLCSCEEVLTLLNPAAEAYIFSTQGTDLEELALVYLDMLAWRFHPKFGANLAQNEAVCDKLLRFLHAAPSAMIAAQVLNALFDIYSDETYDQLFAAKDMPRILSTVRESLAKRLPELKNTLRGEAQRQKLSFIRETHVNLKRFLQYKRDNMTIQ